MSEEKLRNPVPGDVINREGLDWIILWTGHLFLGEAVITVPYFDCDEEFKRGGPCIIIKLEKYLKDVERGCKFVKYVKL